jgi:hypothetical protein
MFPECSLNVLDAARQSQEIDRPTGQESETNGMDEEMERLNRRAGGKSKVLAGEGSFRLWSNTENILGV